MFPSLPLAPSGYTLHVFTVTKRGFGMPQHIARLMSAKGRVCKEWTLTASRWELKHQVASLHDSIDEMLGSRVALPVYFATMHRSDRGGKLQPAFAFAR